MTDHTPAARDTGTDAAPGGRDPKWWTLVAVCVAIFMLLIDITIVNVALPAIQHSLGASFTDLQWVIDAYALTLATCVLTAGSASDLFGRKRIFVAGIVLFVVAGTGCGLAGTRRHTQPGRTSHRCRGGVPACGQTRWQRR